MKLVPVKREEIPLGSALPWMLFDASGSILMEEGTVIETLDDLDALLALDPQRDTTAGANLSENLDELPQRIYSFADMRLRVGDRMQMQPPSAVSTERFVVKVIGYVDNVSLLTTAPLSNGLRVPLRDGDKVVIRVFSNQNAFGFDTTVWRTVKTPFDYLHLVFPKEIQGAVIRKSPRIKTRLVASIYQPDAQGNFQVGDDATRQTGLILNISADGALCEAKAMLTEKGGRLRLTFRVSLHNVDAMISVPAIVRNVFIDETKQKEGKTGGVMHGVQFIDMPQNDGLILQSMIYQTMIEQPHLLA